MGIGLKITTIGGSHKHNHLRGVRSCLLTIKILFFLHVRAKITLLHS